MRVAWVFLSFAVAFCLAEHREDTLLGWHSYDLHAQENQYPILGQLVYSADALIIEERHDVPFKVAVSPMVRLQFEDSLHAYRISFTVTSKDVGRLLEEEREENKRAEFYADLKTAAFDLNSIVSVKDVTTYFAKNADIIAWLSHVASTSKGLCTTQDIGKSYEGRVIRILKCSNGSNRKILWLDSAIHARERLAPSTLLYIIKKLVNDYNAGNSAARAILTKYDFYFLPVVNPDGYDYTFQSSSTRFWRKTRKPYGRYFGADPNRNFDSYFGGPSTSRNPSSDIYCGPSPFSEPETQVMSNYLRSISSRLRLYISFHTYGQLWLTPPGFTRVNPSDHAELMRVANAGANALRKVNNNSWRVGQPANVGLYEAAGGSYDWVREKLKVKYSYTLELRPSWPAGINGFLAYMKDVKPSGEEVYAAVLATGNAVP